MSAFWEAFEQVGECVAEGMGEEIVWDGKPLAGCVVQPAEVQHGAGVGGRVQGFQGMVLVPAGTVVRDGLRAVVRGADCAVVAWEPVAAGGPINVTMGPVNRWNGAIPGT